MSSFKEAAGHSQGTQPPTSGHKLTFEQVKTFLVFLTPLIAPLAGFVSAWIGRHFPGVTVTRGQTTDLFLGGIAAAVFAVATLVLKDRKLLPIGGVLGNLAVGTMAGVPDGPEIEKLIAAQMPDIEALVKQYLPDVEREIEAQLPAAAADALRQLLGQLGLQAAPLQSSAPVVPVTPESPAGAR